jgi:hypothetical protein
MDVSFFKKPILWATAFFGTLLVLSVGYATLSSGLTTADLSSTGGTLRSASWNRLVNSVLELDGRTAAISSTGGNVGVGTASPNSALDVNGTVKASQLNIAKGAHILISLTQCGGGPCAGYQTPLGQWINVASYQYS